VGSLLGAHRTIMQLVVAGPAHVAAPEEVTAAAAGLSPAMHPPPALPLPLAQGAADGHRKRKRRKVQSAGDGASSVPKD